jgi:hypothetical protein
MFVIYQITAIQNTAKDATDFDFQLSKLYASADNPSDNYILDKGLESPATTAPKSLLVPKGTTANNIGRLILFVKGAQQQSSHLLNYNSYKGESVLVVNEDLGQPNANTNPPKPKFLKQCTPNNLP